jgi:signal peptidase I
MKRPKKIAVPVAISFAVLVGLFAVARITGMLQWYTAATAANEPGIKMNSRVVATNLKTPKRYDFVAFKTDQQVMVSKGAILCIYRLVGMPGDVVELRKAVLYVNGANADQQLRLKHSYRVSSAWAASVEAIEGENYFNTGADSGYMFLEDEAAEQQHFRIYSDSSFSLPIRERFHQNWNMDNFGPLKVPAAHYFVLGDNRHAASDSRFIGFIPVKDVSGVVLNR